jgi:hypothetical protein
MPPFTPIPRPEPGPPVNAASTDDNLPAVQGTSLTSLIQFEEQLGGGVGVIGASGSGVGVQATSTSGTGLQATSTTGVAISGNSAGDTDAIVATSSSPNRAALSGVNNGGGYGVWASSTNPGGQGGIGVYGTGAKFAGKFDGDVLITGHLDVFMASEESGALSVIGPSHFLGNMNVIGDIFVGGSDCAEDFDVAVAAAGLDPGTVMVLTENGALQPSEDAYDKKVAGVISGAGDDKPGLILGRCHSSENRMPLALVGKVYCKADAQYGPIEVGDMLTTSPTTGHAMRAADPLKAFGAVIGKALQSLRSGQGLVRILVALQ